MPDTTHNIRLLPIYVEGFTPQRRRLERIRQTQLQATHDTASPAAARHEYAAARLVDVSKVIGGRFRQ